VKPSGQTNFVYFLILIALVAMIFMNINQDSAQTVMSINELAAQITQGNVTKIVEDENSLSLPCRTARNKLPPRNQVLRWLNSSSVMALRRKI